MNKTVKTAVSIPAETYRKAEAMRKKAKKSRSGFVAEALQAYFAVQEKAELDRRDEEGYRRFPEDPAEMDAIMKVVAASWDPKEKW